MPLPLRGPDTAIIRDLVAVANDTTRALRTTIDALRTLAVDVMDVSDRLIAAVEGGADEEDVNRSSDVVEREITHLNTIVGGLLKSVATVRDLARNTADEAIRAHANIRSTEVPEAVAATGRG